MKKDSVRLYIDTRDSRNTIVILVINNERHSVSSKRNAKSELVLKLIDSVIKKAGVKLSEIDEINIERGPGSFTGLRIGVSIANALSFLLNKPVNDKRIGEMEIPTYE